METESLLNFSLEFSDNISLTINERKANKIILGVIISLASIIFLSPIISLLVLLTLGNGISFGLIATCIVSWIISGYLLKLYLWNKYGKEVFIITNDSLSLYYDYHFFKDKHQKIYFKSISVYIEYNDKLKKLTKKVLDVIGEQKSIMTFRVGDKFVSTKNELPIEVIANIAKHLKCVQ